MSLDAPMTPPDRAPVRRLRFGVLLWLAGMLGVAAVNATVLPQLLAHETLPAPLWMIWVASFLQSGLLLALAVWAGVALAPALGLRAPAFEAAATRRPIAPALTPQLLPGFMAGMPGGFLLFAILRFSPIDLAELQARYNPPLLARMLYGGITEELLLRWGLMTALVWLACRFLQGRRGTVRGGLVWLAIVVSALIFGLGHLPVAFAVIDTMNTNIVLFVTGANAMFGVLFGWLFWRTGLESAMIAHAVAHAVSHVITLFWGTA
jgi:membrane protease YdiL (CAAX protease family)